jgi:hypothetical protein
MPSLTLNGDDELRDNRKDFSTTLLEHIENTLNSQETVWVLLLTDTLEEDGKVMVIVKLLDLNLPVDAVLGTVFNSNGKISSVIEAAELACRDVTLIESTSTGLLRCRLLLGLKETDSAATKTLTLLHGCYYFISY